MNNTDILYKPFFDHELTPAPYKYSVFVIKNGKIKLIHFGNRNYEQYYDKLGHWSNLNHLDKKKKAKLFKKIRWNWSYK
jgi:hypothetical protein